MACVCSPRPTAAARPSGLRGKLAPPPRGPLPAMPPSSRPRTTPRGVAADPGAGCRSSCDTVVANRGCRHAAPRARPSRRYSWRCRRPEREVRVPRAGQYYPRHPPGAAAEARRWEGSSPGSSAGALPRVVHREGAGAGRKPCPSCVPPMYKKLASACPCSRRTGRCCRASGCRSPHLARAPCPFRGRA